MIIAGLNVTEQSRVKGGSEPLQLNDSLKASQGNCVTMSDDCPGPQQGRIQPVTLAGGNKQEGGL